MACHRARTLEIQSASATTSRVGTVDAAQTGDRYAVAAEIGRPSDHDDPRRPGTALAAMACMTSTIVAQVRQYPEIREYTTASPHTIARNRSLSVAGRLMRDHHLRHLPVLDGGRIVG